MIHDPASSPIKDRMEPTSGLARDIGKRRPFDMLEEEVFLNLLRTQEHFDAEFNRLFKARGLSGPKYNVLRILRGNQSSSTACQGLPCQKIAEQMITREPDITRLLDRLLKDGLIERERCDQDRRRVLVRITDAGRAIIDALDTPIRDLHRQQLGHLSPADLGTLNTLLYAARQGGPDHREAEGR